MVHNKARYSFGEEHPKDGSARSPHVGHDDSSDSLVSKGKDPGGPDRTAVLPVCQENGMRVAPMGQESGENGRRGETVDIEIGIDEHRLPTGKKLMEPGTGRSHIPERVVPGGTWGLDVIDEGLGIYSPSKQNTDPDRIESPGLGLGIDLLIRHIGHIPCLVFTSGDILVHGQIPSNKDPPS
jgi:hypothetical protein